MILRDEYVVDKLKVQISTEVRGRVVNKSDSDFLGIRPGSRCWVNWCRNMFGQGQPQGHLQNLWLILIGSL